MGAFAQKQNHPQELLSTGLARPKMPSSGIACSNHLFVNSNRTIGNQAAQQMLRTDAKEPEARLTGAPSVRFGHDFGQVPIHPSAAGTPSTPFISELSHSPGRPLDSDEHGFVEPQSSHNLGQLEVDSDVKAAIQRQDELGTAAPPSQTPSVPAGPIPGQEVQPADTADRGPKLYGLLDHSIQGPLTFAPWAFGVQQEPGIGIYSPKMSAYGTVIADTSVQVAEYEIGFVQALIVSRMTATYIDRNGQAVQYLKIGLSQQPIRDSQKGSKPWSKQQDVRSLDTSYIVETEDTPRNMAPWQTPAPGRIGSLSSAEGTDLFCTWLAARHKRSGEMHYLGWGTWMVDWGSAFDAAKQVGRSTGAGGQKMLGGEKRGPFTPLEGDPTANNSITLQWSSSP
ncbi:Uncharacterised protein [uncultured archaeon]|nr:Uncharacterised protein [uncultured archaeon]